MDEAFWQRHRARRERGFGQPCCTQSGMSWTMIDVPGNFAVVIHGEFDCLNCFHHHVGRSAANYYSTRLTEAQLTSGETGPPLRRCLTLIARERRPEAVIVLGTCPVEVIGDRFETVVEDVAAETGVPMIPLHTNGLRLTSQGAMLDWLYSTLAGLGTAEVVPGRVNLLGLPAPDNEFLAAAEVLGLTIGGSFPNVADFAAWRDIGAAAATLAVDPAMTPKLVERLRGRGQVVADVPYPLGAAQTGRVYDALAAVAGDGAAGSGDRPSAAAAALNRPASPGSPFSGRRAVVGVRMMNTYGTQQVAHGGLAEAWALEELGFAVTLVVQGAPESTDAFAATLSDLGARFPFRVFPGPWALAEQLSDFDLCCLSDSSRQEADAAGVPLLASGSMQPWFSGIEANVSRIEDLLG